MFYATVTLPILLNIIIVEDFKLEVLSAEVAILKVDVQRDTLIHSCGRIT